MWPDLHGLKDADEVLAAPYGAAHTLDTGQNQNPVHATTRPSSESSQPMNPLFAVYPSVPGRRTPVKLDPTPLGGGRDAAIYRVTGQPETAAKVWHHVDPGADQRRARLEAMLARPPALAAVELGGTRLPLFAWPDGVLEDARGHCCGHLMPVVPADRTVSLQQYLSLLAQPGNASTQGLHREELGLRRRRQIALHLAMAVAELHRLGHAVIHWQPARMALFWGCGVVCLMGTDEFSILGPDRQCFAAPIYPSDYLAPEMHQDLVAPGRVTDYQQDRHALAVLVYQLFHQGRLPLRPGATLWPAAAAAAPDGFDPGSRALFDLAWNGTDRPSADQWRQHFERLLAEADDDPAPQTRIYPMIAASTLPVPTPAPAPNRAAAASSGSGNSLATRPAAVAVAARSWLGTRQATQVGLGVMIPVVLAAVYWAVTRAPAAPRAPEPPSAPVATPAPPKPGPDKTVTSPHGPLVIDARLKPDMATAAAMRSPTDRPAIQARLRLIQAAMARASQNNAATLDNIQNKAWMTEAPALQQLDDIRQFNSDFDQYFSPWTRFSLQASELQQAAIKAYRQNKLMEAWAQIPTPLALDPESPDTLLAYIQLALLSGEADQAHSAADFALSLPSLREHRRAFWMMRGLTQLAWNNDSAGGKAALWMARGYASSLSDFCSELDTSLERFGPQLRGVIAIIARRLVETEGTAAPRICRSLAG